MCGTIAKSQPENCVVVDESLTSGSMYWDATDAFSPQFTHLTLTGGAIGFGLSAAVGAAVADRSRKVIAFQADGSGLYDCQALWTMARYNLNVCVVICNNSSYNILNIENAMQRVEDANKTNVSKSLTSLGEPTIDWVTIIGPWATNLLEPITHKLNGDIVDARLFVFIIYQILPLL